MYAAYNNNNTCPIGVGLFEIGKWINTLIMICEIGDVKDSNIDFKQFPHRNRKYHRGLHWPHQLLQLVSVSDCQSCYQPHEWRLLVFQPCYTYIQQPFGTKIPVDKIMWLNDQLSITLAAAVKNQVRKSLREGKFWTNNSSIELRLRQ